MLGILIPRSQKDFIDWPLNVLSPDLALLTIAKSLQITLLVFYGPGKYSFLLLLTVSRVTLLQSLIAYGTIHIYHHFIRGLPTHLLMQKSNNFVKQGIQVISCFLQISPGFVQTQEGMSSLLLS